MKTNVRCGFMKERNDYVPVFNTLEEAIALITDPEAQTKMDKYRPGQDIRKTKFYVGTKAYSNIEEVYKDE